VAHKLDPAAEDTTHPAVWAVSHAMRDEGKRLRREPKRRRLAAAAQTGSAV